MSKRINLTNQIFGDWHVLYFDAEKTNGHGSYWKCECLNCGTIKSVRSTHLRSGASTSCGCKSSKIKIGDTFGFLEVLKINEEKSGKGNGRYWDCLCHNCNSIHTTDANTLSRGKVLSCGCMNMSIGEYHIEQFLKTHNISYEKQFSFYDLRPNNYPLKFDFAIYNPNLILIEFQGRQHFEPIEFYGGENGFKKQKERDNLKKEYCKTKNILLYEINYNDDINKKMEEIIYGNNETN